MVMQNTSPSMFRGTKPLPWLTEMEDYFSFKGLSRDDTKIYVAVLYVDSGIFEWIKQRYGSYTKIKDWEEFKYALVYYFGDYMENCLLLGYDEEYIYSGKPIRGQTLRLEENLIYEEESDQEKELNEVKPIEIQEDDLKFHKDDVSEEHVLSQGSVDKSQGNDASDTIKVKEQVSTEESVQREGISSEAEFDGDTIGTEKFSQVRISDLEPYVIAYEKSAVLDDNCWKDLSRFQYGLSMKLISTHQMFDVLFLSTENLKHQKKSLIPKSWKFKFKNMFLHSKEQNLQVLLMKQGLEQWELSLNNMELNEGKQDMIQLDSKKADLHFHMESRGLGDNDSDENRWVHFVSLQHESRTLTLFMKNWKFKFKTPNAKSKENGWGQNKRLHMWIQSLIKGKELVPKEDQSATLVDICHFSIGDYKVKCVLALMLFHTTKAREVESIIPKEWMMQDRNKRKTWKFLKNWKFRFKRRAFKGDPKKFMFCKNLFVRGLSLQDTITMALKCVWVDDAGHLSKCMIQLKLKNLWRQILKRLVLCDNQTGDAPRLPWLKGIGETIRVIRRVLEVVRLEQQAQRAQELNGSIKKRVHDQDSNHVIHKQFPYTLYEENKIMSLFVKNWKFKFKNEASKRKVCNRRRSKGFTCELELKLTYAFYFGALTRPPEVNWVVVLVFVNLFQLELHQHWLCCYHFSIHPSLCGLKFKWALLFQFRSLLRPPETNETKVIQKVIDGSVMKRLHDQSDNKFDMNLGDKVLLRREI